MTPYEILLAAHLIGDFILQTNWMAVNKTVKWPALLTHVTIYTFIVALATRLFAVNLSIWGLLFIFVSHLILDQRTLVRWWVRSVMRAAGPEYEWLPVMVDQIFHLLVLGGSLYM